MAKVLALIGALAALSCVAAMDEHTKHHKGWISYTNPKASPSRSWTAVGEAGDGEPVNVVVFINQDWEPKSVEEKQCKAAINSWIDVAGAGCEGADLGVQWSENEDSVAMEMPAKAAEVFLGAPGFQRFSAGTGKVKLNSGETQNAVIVRTVGMLMVPAQIPACIRGISGVNDFP